MSVIIGSVVCVVAIVAGARVVKLGFKAINKVFDKLDKMI